jgi:hypothetical protein
MWSFPTTEAPWALGSLVLEEELWGGDKIQQVRHRKGTMTDADHPPPEQTQSDGTFKCIHLPPCAADISRDKLNDKGGPDWPKHETKFSSRAQTRQSLLCGKQLFYHVTRKVEPCGDSHLL